MTSLELKMATLKSRVTELEGSLTFSQENTNKVRQQALMDQEKLSALMKEVIDLCIMKFVLLTEKIYNIQSTWIFHTSSHYVTA